MLRKRKPAKIIVAVPVIPHDRVNVFEKNTDEFICLIASHYFRGVGGFYEEFDQVEDAEVIRLLSDANTKK
ncbi:putative phosphoribosyl transferase [compost metagenome]